MIITKEEAHEIYKQAMLNNIAEAKEALRMKCEDECNNIRREAKRGNSQYKFIRPESILAKGFIEKFVIDYFKQLNFNIYINSKHEFVIDWAW